MSQRRASFLVVSSLVLGACAAGTPQAGPHAPSDGSCPDGEFYWAAGDCDPKTIIDVSEIIPVLSPDAIRSIDAPIFDSLEDAADWLTATSPVMAVSVNGDRRAYPLAILTRHEIVNDVVGGVPVVVTYCPLCNSGLAFERTIDGEVLDFGTTGRLWRSNLVMYDRQSRNLWSQFDGKAIVGLRHSGLQLPRIPTSLLGFAQFSEAAPDGQVLSPDSGFGSYGSNPYVAYDQEGTFPFLYQGPTDDRLDVKERVIGFVGESGSVAVTLEHLRAEQVLELSVDGEPVVVFWTLGQASALDEADIDASQDIGTTAAFRPELLDGTRLTFEPDGDGYFEDVETRTTWNLFGDAVAGPREGESLEPVAHDDTFWFVWFAFQPETMLIAS